MPAPVDFDSGTALYSTLYRDVYASADGAFAQATHVFLGGNRLPQRWGTCSSFVIVETGFGAGVNFLATWEAWRRNTPAGAWLHFISAEKHPLRKQDLARVLARTPGYAVGATLLLEQYPPLVAGFHRLTFDSGSV